MNFYLPHTHLGVDLFFLLSGFILYHVYGAFFAGGVRLAAWRGFMIRRLLRIYPLHLATLLLVIVIARFALPPEGLWHLFLNLTLTQAWGLSDEFVYNAPSWSISAEFAAYLLFPFMVVLTTTRAGRLGLLVLVLSAALLLWRLGGGSLDLDDIGRHYALLRVAMGFPLGVLIGWALHTGFRVTDAAASVLQGGAVLALAGGFYAGVSELWMIVPLMVLVFATAGDAGFLGRLLAPAPLQWLGKRSYGIYLWQWPLMVLMFNLDPKLQPYLTTLQLDLARVVIFLTLLFGAATLSWRWLEAPLVKAGHRGAGAIAPRFSARPAP